MSNLIPPAARRAYVTEYWIRVATVYLMLLSFACVALLLLRVPTLTALAFRNNDSAAAISDAESQKDKSSTDEAQIRRANALASMLSADDSSSLQFSRIVSVLSALAGRGVSIDSFTMSRNEETLSLSIAGVAQTRADLRAFDNAIEAHELFSAVDLPISNLANDTDIAYTMTITVSPDSV